MRPAATGRLGSYFETGQGADFTNGHARGFDMVLHEARKYGFARALKTQVAKAQEGAGMPRAPVGSCERRGGFYWP